MDREAKNIEFYFIFLGVIITALLVSQVELCNHENVQKYNLKVALLFTMLSIIFGLDSFAYHAMYHASKIPNFDFCGGVMNFLSGLSAGLSGFFTLLSMKGIFDGF